MLQITKENHFLEASRQASGICNLRRNPSKLSTYFIVPKLGDGPNTVSESTVSNTELGEFSFSQRVPGRELSEFLSPSSLQNSPSLPQNSVSSLFQNSTLETVFRPFPQSAENDPCWTKKSTPFPRESANLPHCTYFTHIPVLFLSLKPTASIDPGVLKSGFGVDLLF